MYLLCISLSLQGKVADGVYVQYREVRRVGEVIPLAGTHTYNDDRLVVPGKGALSPLQKVSSYSGRNFSGANLDGMYVVIKALVSLRTLSKCELLERRRATKL